MMSVLAASIGTMGTAIPVVLFLCFDYNAGYF